MYPESSKLVFLIYFRVSMCTSYLILNTRHVEIEIWILSVFLKCPTITIFNLFEHFSKPASCQIDRKLKSVKKWKAGLKIY